MDKQTVLSGNEFGDLRGRFARAVNLTISGGANHYKRERHLQRLICHDSQQFHENPGCETIKIVRKLCSAIRHERRLGKTGHWAYDLNRHIGLRQALRAELKNLRELRKVKQPHQDASFCRVRCLAFCTDKKTS